MNEDQTICHEMKDVQAEMVVVSHCEEIAYHSKHSECRFDLLYFQPIHLVEHCRCNRTTPVFLCEGEYVFSGLRVFGPAKIDSDAYVRSARKAVHVLTQTRLSNI